MDTSRHIFVSILVICLFFSLSACSLQWDNSSKSSKTTTSKKPTRTSSPKKTGSRHIGPRPAVHVVKSGESFYSIALYYGLNYKTIAAWNNMSTKDVIFRGQKLKLHAPKSSSKSSVPSSVSSTGVSKSVSKLKLQWPLKGRIINRFNDQDRTIKGIDIAGQSGQRIKAAAAGKVVYAGSGLVGLGNVLVIKHNETYLTAYGYNDKLLFSEGATVAQGQEIAIIGIGPDNQTMLHFEVRKNGKPVDPMGYLAK